MKIIVNSGQIKTIQSLGKRVFEGQFTGDDGAAFQATVWELDKDGSKFPGFDSLAAGQAIEGNKYVAQSTGKVTIYPPKPQAAPSSVPTGKFGGGGIKAAQERKAADIEKAQDRKAESIAFFNATNSAIALVIANNKGEHPLSEEGLKKEIVFWRSWFLAEWERWDGTAIPF